MPIELVEKVRAAPKVDGGNYWRSQYLVEQRRADALTRTLRWSQQCSRRWKAAAIILATAGIVCGMLVLLT